MRALQWWFKGERWAAINCITVIEVPAQDGTHLGTTILIDNGFSGHAIMSHAFAKSLSYEFQPSEGNSYRTTAGHMATQNQITIQGIHLPHLSHHRKFDATVEIAPEESGDFGYGVIMGIGMMDKLDIDQSRTSKTITWWEDVKVPMVPQGYWTETRIQKICSKSSAEKHKISGQDKENRVYFPTEPTMFLTNTPSFTKAVYNTPDLLEIVKCDRSSLTMDQRSTLLQVLTQNNKWLKGERDTTQGSQ